MTYPDAIRFFDSFINYEKQDGYDYRRSFDLERVRNVASLLGYPHKAAPSIHVAGTKGKGSTAAIISAILRSAGYRVGLYTSPHLISFRERIRVDDALITEDDIGRLANAVKDAASRVPGLSYFEVITALAWLYFKERRVDYAVYEVGLGGRLDATNIVDPLVSVITPISYEHTDKLGPTLAKIAFEKAGIIKEGVPVVSGPQEKEAGDEIRRIAHERKAPLTVVGRDIGYTQIRANEAGEVFDVAGQGGRYRHLEMRLLGAHQVANAATAIAAVETLARHGIVIPESAIRGGVASARWEGRLEIAGRRPYVILDGAQNRASAKALAGAIRRIFRYMKLILILGVSKDKDLPGILEELLPVADAVIVTKADMPGRAMEPERIGDAIGKRAAVSVARSVADALAQARAMAAPEDLIVVTGSLFVVGEAKRHCEALQGPKQSLDCGIASSAKLRIQQPPRNDRSTH